jgi:SEC-C motif domain protein
MRSRYTAFVLRDEAHVRRTWHPSTRPDDLALEPTLEWLGLEILAVWDGAEEPATVTFRARWRTRATEPGRGPSLDGSRHENGVLLERSRFVRRGGSAGDATAGRWVYLDGEIIPEPA